MNKIKKTFYITTPIYYSSGKLHIGHLYTTTLAYVMSNYKKMIGYDVKFLTGADEHGYKIETIAKSAKIPTIDFVNKTTKSFNELWALAEIKPDYFSRTTNKQHMLAVQKQFSYLLKENIIYKGTYEGLYSIQDEEFVTETQAKKQEGKFYHKLSGHPLIKIKEETYFIRISKFEEWVKNFLEKSNILIPKKIVKELVNNFVDKKLKDLSVTRTSFEWGIKVKEDAKHTIYVWMDALNNYLTALGYNSSNDYDFKKYWINGDEIVHVVGKEIARFHGIYWPIILKVNNLRLPTKILSHGWIVTKDGKMSKSKGNIVDPVKLINKYGAEVVKFYFATHINQFEDSIFSEDLLVASYNADLANNIGNLINRTLTMIKNNFTKPINFKKTNDENNKKIEKEIIQSKLKFENHFNSFEINKGLMVAIELGKKLNKYIDITEPWKLKRQSFGIRTNSN